MLWLLGIGSWAKSALSGVLRAVTANPWPTAVIALSLVCAMLWRADGHHRAQRDKALIAKIAEHDAHVADNTTWANAFNVEHNSVQTLLASNATRNAAIDTMARQRDTAHAGQQEALRAAQTRGAGAEALAARIVAERATGCKTGAAVMAGRDRL